MVDRRYWSLLVDRQYIGRYWLTDIGHCITLFFLLLPIIVLLLLLLLIWEKMA